MRINLFREESELRRPVYLSLDNGFDPIRKSDRVTILMHPVDPIDSDDSHERLLARIVDANLSYPGRPPCVNHRASASFIRDPCVTRSSRSVERAGVARRRRVNHGPTILAHDVSYFQRFESPAG